VQGQTTGQVAQELEAKYGIVQKFYELQQEAVVGMVTDSAVEAMVNVIEDAARRIPNATVHSVGKPPTGNSGRPTFPEMSTEQLSQIEAMFRDSLSAGAFDGAISGVPTVASVRGNGPRSLGCEDKCAAVGGDAFRALSNHHATTCELFKQSHFAKADVVSPTTPAGSQTIVRDGPCTSDRVRDPARGI
jgi:hypothetical protein